MSTEKKRSSSSMHMPDWSLLPEELLQIISNALDNCFDVVHARSVCSSWRSTIPFPCSLLRPSYSIPSFDDEISLENKEALWIIEKIPLFLFYRVSTLDAGASASEFFLGGIGRRDESELRPFPLQCSVKMKTTGSDETLMNMLDCEILPMGHDQYRMIGMKLEGYGGMAFLPLNKEGGREFVVVLNHSNALLVLTSAEMKWKRLENVPVEACWDLVIFRGKFYASLCTGKTVVIDPYSLDVTLLMPSLHQGLLNHLVPSGNDELYLVEEFIARQFVLRVSRLDEEAGKWVEVSDLGDRVLFINHGQLEHVSCSAKELPDGWGLSKNSILIIYDPCVTLFYKYVSDLNRWRQSGENLVTIFKSSPVVAFQVDRAKP